MPMKFTELLWSLLLLAAGSYLIGNISFARLISRGKNKDITKEGSGNPGTLNMSRTFGLKIGILTLVLDISKGAIPALVGKFAFAGWNFGKSGMPVADFAVYLAGFFVVLGHIFPVIHRFRGGKGIATTIGVFLVGEFPVTAIFAVVAIIYILITAMGSMGSFIVTTPPAIAALVRLYRLGFKSNKFSGPGLTFFLVTEILIIGIIMLTWYAHRQNIKRLLAGEEHETGWLDMLYEKHMKKKAARLKKSLEGDTLNSGTIKELKDNKEEAGCEKEDRQGNKSDNK